MKIGIPAPVSALDTGRQKHHEPGDIDVVSVDGRVVQINFTCKCGERVSIACDTGNQTPAPDPTRALS